MYEFTLMLKDNLSQNSSVMYAVQPLKQQFSKAGLNLAYLKDENAVRVLAKNAKL